jgi:flagellar hook-length control protein FliK
MVLALRCGEWGALRIELVVEGAEVRASVLTECGRARDAIVAQLDDLRRRLEDRGLELGAFQVRVGRQDPEAEEEHGPAPRSARPQLLDVLV